MNTFIHSFKLDCSSISISEICQTLVRRIMLASAKKWKTLLFPPLRNQILQWENYVPQSAVRVFLLTYSCPMVLWQVHFISRLAILWVLRPPLLLIFPVVYFSQILFEFSGFTYCSFICLSVCLYEMGSYVTVQACLKLWNYPASAFFLVCLLVCMK